MTAAIKANVGLPPPSRGAPHPDEPEPDSRGPTPAFAGSTLLGVAQGTPQSAYPRLRGEHFGFDDVGHGLVGLPPPSRGAQRRTGRHHYVGGPTPAFAGSTTSAVQPSARPRAYPRLRGEHNVNAPVRSSGKGLPPPSRGALLAPRQQSALCGPTPAFAGSTAQATTWAAIYRAYPRLRGEHSLRPVSRVPSAGLPPPSRGALEVRASAHRLRGPTPAFAGSTRRPARSRPSRQAYPRLRGEHTAQGRQGRPWDGLPPPSRGAQRLYLAGRGGSWPTPAFAGSTGKALEGADLGSAYPRLRGEHDRTASSVMTDIGLPPPSRGAQGLLHHRSGNRGPTPAFAGSTLRCVARALPRWAYPRLRGEHERHRLREQIRTGLPPPSRGAPSRGRPVRSYCRPTPAFAGSTSSTKPIKSPSRAYPRLRGEHHARQKARPCRGGLPPPSRGAQQCVSLVSFKRRPTPAFAGSTAFLTVPIELVKAYPRLRGEHLGDTASAAVYVGLPPPSRGAHR